MSSCSVVGRSAGFVELVMAGKRLMRRLIRAGNKRDMRRRVFRTRSLRGFEEGV